MIILGVNAFHPDSSACIVKDGEIIVAIEEERLRRIKHWSGFPSLAIEACLNVCKMSFSDINYIAINRDSSSHRSEKIFYSLKTRPTLKNIFNRLKKRKNIRDIASIFEDHFNVEKSLIEKKIHYVEHHYAHLAATYLTSSFDEAAILSVDGFGDFVSTMWGIGENDSINVSEYVPFPSSLGILYQTITQYLGFMNYGDEYKVMGMSAYGKPNFINEMSKLIKLSDNGMFSLDTKFFKHSDEGVSMEFENSSPKIGEIFSNNLISLLGPKRNPGEEISQRHKDIARSIQETYEQAFFHILKQLEKEKNTSNLCLAGGCAQNSLANGKIHDKTQFKNIWVHPAAGDAGGAVGAALAISNIKFKEKRHFMSSAALGIGYSNQDVKFVLDKYDLEKFDLKFIDSEEDLILNIVHNLVEGRVIGLFRGRFEWGPRALGNRSIIADPRIKNMKKLMNEKIKKREGFRPFAPSILIEFVEDWFEHFEEVPFMTQVLKIKEDKREIIPSVTHEDGTGRLQTVDIEGNPFYHSLIKSFHSKTTVPMILNTSFNENEPIVNTPDEAIDCFLRTNMDVLVLENYIICR